VLKLGAWLYRRQTRLLVEQQRLDVATWKPDARPRQSLTRTSRDAIGPRPAWFFAFGVKAVVMVFSI